MHSSRFPFSGKPLPLKPGAAQTARVLRVATEAEYRNRADPDRAADVETHFGWSVVVTGRAEIVTDPAEVARLERIGPSSWAPSPVEVFVRIEPELVTGRELVGGRTMYGLHLSA
ncbi:pyridoxamine 5'-phosphate oxidase family protein [Streptomyces sp. NPDC001393]